MKEILLRIESNNPKGRFTAGAVYRKGSKGWYCAYCAPILRKFLERKTPKVAKKIIESYGWQYEWINMDGKVI